MECPACWLKEVEDLGYKLARKEGGGGKEVVTANLFVCLSKQDSM